MSNIQYIGARYVTKIYENSLDPSSAEWEPSVNYEPLVMVTYNNGSYLSKKTVPANIGNPPANPSYWVQTGFYNGQIANLQNQIDAINNNLSDFAELINDNENMIKSGKPVIANIVINDFFDVSQKYTGGAQGSCYVKNNLAVVYYAESNSTTGSLVCYNLKSKTKVWEYNLECFHGNSITYNPNNNMLYISGALNNGLINAILEVDFANPAIINRTITLPDTSGNYSLVYDPEKNVFYATNNVGSTAGLSDVLTIYDDTLTTKLGEIILENYPSIAYGYNLQGVQLAIDGVAYVLAYSSNPYIVGYDVSTGNIVSVFNLPEYASGCRAISEYQSIIYDRSSKRFFVTGSSYSSDTGIGSWQCTNIVEIDAFKGIEYHEPIPYIATGYTDFNQRTVRVYNGDDSLEPLYLQGSRSSLQCAADAVNIARLTGFLWIIIDASSPKDEIANLKLNGVSARFQGPNASNRFKMRNVNAQNADLGFYYIHFVGYFQWATGYYANARFQLSDVYLQNCEFDAFSSGGIDNHLVCYSHCDVVTDTIIYDGSFVTDVRLVNSMLNGIFTQY